MKQIYDNKDIGETIDKSFDAGIKEGYRRCREQMMKEAVEGVLVDNVDGTQEICLHGNRYGEKIRIIIVKDNEK